MVIKDGIVIADEDLISRTHFDVLDIKNEVIAPNNIGVDTLINYQGIIYQILNIDTPTNNIQSGKTSYKCKQIDKLASTFDDKRYISLLGIGDSNITNGVIGGDPYYKLDLKQIYDLWQINQDSTYLEYRLGYSKLLKIERSEVTSQDGIITMHLLQYRSPVCIEAIHIPFNTPIPVNRNGEMVKENHNVEVLKYTKTDPADVQKGDIIRVSNGTHEYDLEVYSCTPCTTELKDSMILYKYDLYLAKGMNFHGLQLKV